MLRSVSVSSNKEKHMSRTKRSTRSTPSLQNLKTLAIARVEAARTKAGDMVSSLEKVFEQRVSGAISRLGVPTATEVRTLSRQVAELKASVERLRKARA
jgi:poly(hydroxyalkanoate) granule-associated protein